MRRTQQRMTIVMLALVAAALGGTRSVAAQEPLALANRGPRFLYASTPASAAQPIDAGSVPALRQQLSLDLDGVPLADALAAITRETGLAFVYSRDLLPADARVSLRAQQITLAAALTEVLLDAGVDVLLLPGGRQAALMKRKEGHLVEPPGSVKGRVTDEKTGQGLEGASVKLEGTRLSAITEDRGAYRIAEVPPGRYTLTTRRLGYAEQSQTVTVASAQEVTADVVLEPVATKLDEIVTTATGEQRLRELGHVVGRINADSLVREAPVSNISQLLTGRIPGLQVFQTSGIVGGDVQLQVRTPNSLLLGQQPIVIVDGVRYTNTAARDPTRNGQSGASSIYGRSLSAGPATGFEVTSPLNDLNPNDIESIEVVKGPTAATLYGTDAANGVLLITTKRGHAGPARWNVYTRANLTETPQNRFPKQYWAWGSYPDGQPYGFTSGGQFHPSNCMLASVATGACVQDSITVFDPLADPGLTIFKSAPQWEYGMNVSGGTAAVRYYVAGSFQRETGPIRMPQAFVDSIEAARGSRLPEEQLRPNALTNLNLRSNLTASVGTLQLQGNLGYVRRRNRTIDNGVYSDVGGNGSPAFPWGSNTSQYGGTSPAEVFSRTSINDVNRFIAGARADWQLLSWLQARAGAGMDLSLGTTNSLLRRGEAVDFSGKPLSGSVLEEVDQQRGTSADVGLTASFMLGRRVSSRTSVGAQYNRSLNEIRVSSGTGLVPGGESVVQADTRSADRVYNETAALGSYAEETLGLNGRLFLTGALRIDGASNFGQKYQSAVYPKAGASWVISEEPFMPHLPGLDELRLRYAFGASGQQAYTWMKLPAFATPQAVVEGPQTAVIDVTALGNEHLRPERVKEQEFGFDLAALGNRVDLGLVWYRRRVVDQILSLSLPPGLGTIYTNLGLTTAHGFEVNLHATVLDSRNLSWDLFLNHASSSTRVEDLGDAAARTSYLGGYKEGYSLGARFYRPYQGFEDTNGDGIIVSSELQWGDTAVYVGESIPTVTQSLHSVFGFFNHHLRVSASFNRSAGHVRAVGAGGPCTGGKCLALLDSSTPVEQQAAALAARTRVQSTNIPANETRFSALTVTADLPARLLAPLHVHSGTISLSASNLALWTDYPGDPESVQVLGFSTDLSPSVPRARSWTFRLDLGF